jgi:predicted nucleotide-binding protein
MLRNHGKAHEMDERTAKGPRDVFVIVGRNTALNVAMFDLLRALDLHPLEWEELKARTGKGSPYIGDIVKEAFDTCSAIVALITPDETAQLRPEFQRDADTESDRVCGNQARLNVYYEIGYAMAVNEKATVLVECGRLRPVSDLAGRHVIRFDGSAEKRQELATQLKSAGCPVNQNGTHWQSAGDFQSIMDQLPDPGIERSEGSHAELADAWDWISHQEDEVQALLQLFVHKNVYMMEFNHFTGCKLLVDTKLARVSVSQLDLIVARTVLHTRSRFELLPHVRAALWPHKDEFLLSLDANRMRFPHLWDREG